MGLRVSLHGRFAAFPRPFWLLIAGTFIYLVGYDLGYPYETIYLHHSLGLSLTTIGLMLGLPLLAGLPMMIVGGALADRYGRLPVLRLGICASATLFAGLALAGQLWQLVLFVAFEAACGWTMFSTANSAMIADLTPAKQRARAYSLSRVAVSSGMVVGPLCGSLLLRLGAGFRTLFACGSALCLVFLVFSLLMFTETRPAPLPSADSRSAWAGYRRVLSDRRFLSLCAVTLLPLYGFGQLWVTFPIALHERLGVSAASWGLLITLYALAIVLFQYPLVRRLERYDKTALMAAGSALVGVGMGGAALLMRSWPIVVFMLLVSLGVMLLIPISATVVAEMAPASLRGRYMGAWTLAWTLGTALGPTLGGPLMDLLGVRGAYMLVLACGLAGSGLFLVRGRCLAAPAVTRPSS